MIKSIPKVEAQWFLLSLKDLINHELESGVVDMSVINGLIDTIIQKVLDY